MLPMFVESLGGKFVKSQNPFGGRSWPKADVLVAAAPRRALAGGICWNAFGSTFAAAVRCCWWPSRRFTKADSLSSFNDVLRPTAMQVRFDTAVTRTGNWEQSYEVLAHPATAGIDDSAEPVRRAIGLVDPHALAGPAGAGGALGLERSGQRRRRARAVASYNAGELLGDLVLAAEQPFGKGRIFVLGGTSPLQNEMLANAYPFVGRLLGYLANRPSSPQDLLAAIAGPAVALALAGAAGPAAGGVAS